MEQTLETSNTPIFSFANGELHPFQNGIIRQLERVTGERVHFHVGREWAEWVQHGAHAGEPPAYSTSRGPL